MDLVEISPFFFVLSEKDYGGEYTEITLENFEDELRENTEVPSVKAVLGMILNGFPHKNYIPTGYLLNHSMLCEENPKEVLRCLLENSSLHPIWNKNRLCFSFKNHGNVARLSDIVESNPYEIFGQVVKVIDSHNIYIGEDLIVIINDIERIFKNTSENYMKADKFKENSKKLKRKVEKKGLALRDISNSGN